MRRRLIDATLECLVADGYAGLTIGSIVERAGVSRGAPLHHFASKAALIEAAAEDLFAQVSHAVNAAYEEARPDDDPLGTFLLLLWKRVFAADMGTMIAELSHASRHDADLAVIMERLLLRIYQIASRVSIRYVRTRSDSVPAARITILTQWMMRGMAMDRHFGAPDALFERYLEHWRTLLDSAIDDEAQG